MAIKEFRLKNGRSEVIGSWESMALKSEGSGFFTDAGATKWLYRPVAWKDAEIFRVRHGLRPGDFAGWIQKEGQGFVWAKTDDMKRKSKPEKSMQACTVALLNSSE
jgi:hypothetical protein